MILCLCVRGTCDTCDYSVQLVTSCECLTGKYMLDTTLTRCVTITPHVSSFTAVSTLVRIYLDAGLWRL